MTPPTGLSKEIIEILKEFDTPSICNAIETLNIRLNNEGYMGSTPIEHHPPSQSMVGYAVTLHMRTANPPIRGRDYIEKAEWWKRILSFPAPRIAVIQDVDSPSGIGAVVGLTHIAVLQSLDCIGIVTNGSVRNLPFIKDIGMHLYANSLSPSHGYAHFVDVGKPVNIGGLEIKSGDLLHGDCHGIVSVPQEKHHEIIEVSHQILKNKKLIIDYCLKNGGTKSFSLDELYLLLKNPS